MSDVVGEHETSIGFVYGRLGMKVPKGSNLYVQLFNYFYDKDTIQQA